MIASLSLWTKDKVLAEAKCSDLPKEAVSKANTYCTDSEYFFGNEKKWLAYSENI